MKTLIHCSLLTGLLLWKFAAAGQTITWSAEAHGDDAGAQNIGNTMGYFVTSRGPGFSSVNSYWAAPGIFYVDADASAASDASNGGSADVTVLVPFTIQPIAPTTETTVPLAVLVNGVAEMEWGGMPSQVGGNASISASWGETGKNGQIQTTEGVWPIAEANETVGTVTIKNPLTANVSVGAAYAVQLVVTAAAAANIPKDGVGFATSEAWFYLQFACPTNFQVVLPQVVQPIMTNCVYQQGEFIFSGTNGLPNQAYYVLNSTNLALPLKQWATIATNAFSASGTFSATVTNQAGLPASFFAIEVAPPPH